MWASTTSTCGACRRRPEGHVGARPGDGQHHARRREPRPHERDHGRAEGLLRPRRSRGEDGIARPQGHRHSGPDAGLSDRAAVQALQSRDRAEAAGHLGRQARAEDDGHAVPVQAEPDARRDGDEEQPGDDLDGSSRRGAHHAVPIGHGGLLPLPGELPSAERPEHGRARQVRPRRRARVRDARQVRPEHRRRSHRVGHPPEQHLQ